MLNKISLYLGILSFILVLFLGSYVFFYKDKVAYVDSAIMFDKYKGKLEIEKSLNQSKNMNNAYFDSLQLELKIMQQTIQNGNGDKVALQEKYMKYSAMYQQYKQQEEETIKKYDEQIWGQINQYIKEYGNKYKYKYIYGLNGNGSYMYVNKNDDITEDVLNFINEKYEGK